MKKQLILVITALFTFGIVGSALANNTIEASSPAPETTAYLYAAPYLEMASSMDAEATIAPLVAQYAAPFLDDSASVLSAATISPLAAKYAAPFLSETASVPSAATISPLAAQYAAPFLNNAADQASIAPSALQYVLPYLNAETMDNIVGEFSPQFVD
jgi:hypothetical protein